MKYISKIILLVFLLTNQTILFGQNSQGEKVVQGTITSSTDGETLVGVNVTEMSADSRIVSAVVTDFNGQYVIKIKDAANNKLVISYIGFKSQSRDITGSTMNIVLQEELTELDVVTVKAEVMHNDGTFSISQREIATATQRISTEEFEGLQVTSIDEALQGRIAGLDIVGNSGDPGSGTSMRIRGATSINGNGIPLIVINNIPYESEIDENFDFANSNQEQYANMLSINPEDIEDITVLKDAASSAVWGSRGANGVIMIKIKRGSRGPTRFSYSYKLTRTVLPEGIKMLNGDDYTMMMKQAYFNPYQNEFASNKRELNYDPSFSEFENYNNNTNWVKEVSQTGMIHDHTLSASGGGERANYRISLGYLTQKGTVIGQELDRISTRSTLEYAISDRLRVVSEFAFTYTDNQRNALMWDPYNWGNNDKKIGLLANAYRKMPNESVYEQDALGNNTDVYHNIALDTELGYYQQQLANPVALANLGINNLKNYRIIPTLRVNYDIIRPERHRLLYSAYVSFDLDNSNVFEFIPSEALRYGYSNSLVNKSSGSDGENLSFQTDNNVTFTPKFNNPDHTLTTYVSFQARSGRHEEQSNSVYGLPSSDITDPSSPGRISYIGSKRSQWRSVGFLARAHYVYKNRYILSGTIRRDGNTKFGIDRKFGNFPGVSMKWIISDEPFMASTKNWLSMLAIRPSWGISGNVPKKEYEHFSRYGSSGTYIDLVAVEPVSPKLNDLRWEKTSAFNVGSDIGFWNDKITLDANYYYQRTEDMLFYNMRIPSTSGFSVIPTVNGGTMDNEGWEFNVFGNRVIKVNDFSVDFSFNIANNKNTLIYLIPEIMETFNQPANLVNGEYLTRIQENNSFGSIYGYRYMGVYKYNDYIAGTQEDAPVGRDDMGNVIYDNEGEPLPMRFGYGVDAFYQGEGYEFKGGDAKYEDINHDGNIDELDIVYLGNSNPKFFGGFGTTLRYQNLSLNIFFNYRYGNKIVNVAKMNAENMYGDDNQSIAVNYRWRKDGDDTEMPRALYNYGYNWLGSDRFVEDGSFLRLKYLTMRYNIPKEKLKNLGLNRLDFFLTINNLFVFSKYSGVDPEVGYGKLGVSTDNAQTPRTKDIMFGVTVGF